MVKTSGDYARKDTGLQTFITVWIGLIISSLIEVFVASRHPSTRVLIGILWAMAIVNAGLVLAFFMHLRYEQRRLVLSVIPALVFVMLMMTEMVPDSVRAHNLRSPIKIETPPPAQQ